MIRVLQIVAGMNSGGIENLIMNIYRNIDKTKVQFDFLYHTNQECYFDKEIEALGGNIYKFPMSEEVDFIKYCKFLKKFFSENDYKIVHSHYSMLGVFYNYYAKKYGSKILIGHAHTNSVIGSGLNKIADMILTPLYKYNLDYRFACSQQAGEYMFNKKPFEIYANGIDIKKFSYSEENRKKIREKFNLKENDFVIGSVGQFREEKNQIWLIRLVAQLLNHNPNIYLILVGDGIQRKNIEDEINKYEVQKNVILAGFQAKPEEYYNAMDLFVLPSVFEGMPVCVIEAQANGLEAIVSTGVTKAVNLTNNIEFFPLSDMDSWEKFILARLKSNKSRQNTIQEIIKAGYGSETIAKKIQKFYINTLKGKI